MPKIKTLKMTKNTTPKTKKRNIPARKCTTRSRSRFYKDNFSNISAEETETTISHYSQCISPKMNNIVDVTDDDIIEESEVSSSISKSVESKVNDFFKSNNLLSDDEEEEPTCSTSNNSKSVCEKVDAVTKNARSTSFYTISSDSDDEVTISKMSIDNSLKANTSQNCKTVDKSEANNTSAVNICDSDDSYMEIVNNILETQTSDAKTEAPPEKSLEDYKKETEALLSSVSSLINDISEKPEPKVEEEPKKPEKESPKKEKLACPICMEQIGGSGGPAATTLCGHVFCKECITQVAKSQKKCPTCRKTINLKKIVTVYL